MNALVEDFLQHLRNERGQSENTQKTYFAVLRQFVAWAGRQGVTQWSSIELSHLLSFLQEEQARRLRGEGDASHAGCTSRRGLTTPPTLAQPP